MMINIKLLYRNLTRGKSYTALNIIGLAIGMACTFIVIIWVKNERSYDKYLPAYERTYRLTFETNQSGTRFHFARCWEPWIWQMPGTFPQIEEMVRLAPFRHTAVKSGENKIYSDRIFATDTNFFKIFGPNLVSGDIEKVLKEPYSAVVSRTLASKFFGEANPVGQVILLSGEYDTKMTPYTIKGVMKDTPVNSHIHFDILTSFVDPEEAPAWAYIYILLSENASPDDIIKGLPSFIDEVKKENTIISFTPYLQKVTDIHLYSDKDREVEPNGNITSIYLFILASLVVIIVSWVNYYNLSKARLLMARKQIHIQRLNGSPKWLILFQTALESGINVIISFFLSLLIIDLPGSLAKAALGYSFSSSIVHEIVNIWPIIGLILVLSGLAGTMPLIIYFIHTGNKADGLSIPTASYRNKFTSYGLLITIQYGLSIILVVSTITIFKQKELMFSSSMGNMSSDILILKKQNWEIRAKYKAFRDKALQSPYIKDITASIEEPSGETLDATKIESSGIDEDKKENLLYYLAVEDNFISFFNIPLIAGRNFSPFNAERKGEDYILNEAAVTQLGWTAEEAIGQPFSINFNSPDIFYGGTVIGVVKDFNFTTLKQEVKPYFLFQKPIFYLCFMIKIDPDHRKEAILSLNNIWEEELPDYPFSYEFMDDLYKSAYKKELSQSKLTTFFSILAVLIVCLGLYAVSSLLVVQRTKEIGIRKVNGAGKIDIMLLLSSDFVRWFVIAFIMSTPLSMYIMRRWLDSFVYKTSISLWVFLLAGMIVLVVTLCTVLLRSWRAATKNPIEALRYE